MGARTRPGQDPNHCLDCTRPKGRRRENSRSRLQCTHDQADQTADIARSTSRLRRIPTNMTPNGNTSRRVTVSVDPDLEELIPGFLENRRKDAAVLARAAKAGDEKTIRLLGHRMKGDGGGYGFQEISQIGEALEQAATRQDWKVIVEKTEALTAFLAQVDVVYRR